jgi:hypothetical protein
VARRTVCILFLAVLLLSGAAQARSTRLGRALGIADNRRQGMLVGMGTGLSFSYARTKSGDLVKDATRASALYLDAGVGIGAINNPDAIEIPSSRTSGAEPGVTPYVGVGYEFATHASVLGRVMYTHSGETSKGFHNERDALSLVVTFRFISY